MMENPVGTGMVPMALGLDGKHRCGINDCQFLGQGICRWPRHPWLGGETEGGCGQRYCANHRYCKT